MKTEPPGPAGDSEVNALFDRLDAAVAVSFGRDSDDRPIITAEAYAKVQAYAAEHGLTAPLELFNVLPAPVLPQPLFIRELVWLFNVRRGYAKEWERPR